MSKFTELINGEKPVLIDFFATWCGPCKMMPPILKKLKDNIGDKATIITIDVDKNQALAQKFNIRGVPTLAIFKDGKIVWKKSGVRQVNELESIISQYY